MYYTIKNNINMRVLISKATGYIGSHLTEELRNKENELFAIVRNISKANSLIKSGINIIRADISEKDSLDALPNDIDIVIHLAFSLFP